MINKAIWAVIPAAGVGARMQADRPKQYLLLDNKTVIEHTLNRLSSHPKIAGVIVAIAADDPWWADLSLNLSCDIHLAQGGENRADSVLNALKKLASITDTNPWVLVHDAARPCIRHDDIDSMLEILIEHPVGGILGVPVNDTVKRVNDQRAITDTVERVGLWRASTPQMFKLEALSTALMDAEKKGFTVTDEASAMELAGFQPMMVEGHADNIKITLPQDLALAELFLQQQAGES